MDELALQFQQQLHDANQQRMAAIEDRIFNVEVNQKTQGETLARIEENTKGLGAIADKVEELEKTDSKHKGVAWVVGILWAGITAWIEARRK